MRWYNVFQESNTVELGIESIIENADRELSKFPEANQAIDDFVGHSAGAKDRSNTFGIMLAHKLEDAFSNTPSSEGKVIRKQLEYVFAPIRQALKSRFGDSITLYRHQRSVNANANRTRNVLSWTSDFGVARWFADAGPMFDIISDNDIKKAVLQYESTGKTSALGYTFIRNEDNPKYFDIYKNDDHITDGENLSEWLEERRAEQIEYNDAIKAKMESILSENIPLDHVVWVTNRANQSEFIVANKINTKWFIDAMGKPGKQN